MDFRKIRVVPLKLKSIRRATAPVLQDEVVHPAHRLDRGQEV